MNNLHRLPPFCRLDFAIVVWFYWDNHVDNTFHRIFVIVVFPVSIDRLASSPHRWHISNAVPMLFSIHFYARYTERKIECEKWKEKKRDREKIKINELEKQAEIKYREFEKWKTISLVLCIYALWCPNHFRYTYLMAL